MLTKVFNLINPEKSTDFQNILSYDDILKECATIILSGGLVATPTETVYGLCANALSPDSVKHTYNAKGRPSDNPLIVHIDSYEMLDLVTNNVSDKAKQLMDNFWPGPITFILPKSEVVPYETTANLETVAVRFPSNKIMLDLITTCGVPLSAPSANTSTRPSPTKASHVFEDLQGKIAAIIDGGDCDLGVESTVVDMTSDVPVVLRPGFVTYEMIKKILPETRIDSSLVENLEISNPKSPGMKYKHYAPTCDIFVVTSNIFENIHENINLLALEALNNNEKVGILATTQSLKFYDSSKYFVFNLGDRNNLQEISQNLFNSFRIMEQNNITKVFAEDIGNENEALAIMNRLKKASGYKILNF